MSAAEVQIPRVRMFAGPNGSGKSSLKGVIPPVLLGVYVNADDIEREIKKTGSLDLAPFQIDLTTRELRSHYRSAGLLKRADMLSIADDVDVSNGRIIFSNFGSVNSYHASVAAALFRELLLKKGLTFTFETVMSFPDKIEFLERAQASGYRTYLYFVATESPEINVLRVKSRVQLGGHDVPEDKIRKRYYESLALLPRAIQASYRAFIFDNSTEGSDDVELPHTLVAEVMSGVNLEWKSSAIPTWFQPVVDEYFISAP